MNKLTFTLISACLATILLFGANKTLVAQDYKITMLGNSITQGKAVQGIDDIYSYRYHLWTQLLDYGMDFDFVGSQVDMEITSPGASNPDWPDHLGQSFDQDHEGHGGYRGEQLRDTLSRWLLGYTPDIALLHIGSNDMFQQYPNVDQTIREIQDIIQVYRNANPYVTIFLAKIIPVGDSPFFDYSNDSIDALNLKIPDIATTMSDARSPIHIVDCNTGMTVPDDYIGDDIHPNAAGEVKIATAFYNALIANLPAPQHRWIGTESTTWSDPDNWNQPTVPGPTSNVSIPDGTPFSPTYTGDLRLGSEIGTLTMDGSSELTITGDFVIQPGQSFIARGESQLNLYGDWTYDGTYYGGGKLDRDGATSFNWSGNDAYLEFEAYEPFKLASATVYGAEISGAVASNRTFYWKDESGVVQQEKTVFIEKGKNRITLDFDIDITGEVLRLGVYEQVGGQIPLWRDRTRVDGVWGADYPYPYDIGEVADILQSSTNSPNHKKVYPFFYDIAYFPSSDNEENPGFSAGNTDVTFYGTEISRMTGSPGYSGGGMVNRHSDTAGAYTWSASVNNRLNFDCQAPFTLVSAKVYTTGTAGPKTFYWATNDGTIQETTTVEVESNSEGVRIPLNFHITPGSNHYMGVTGVSTQPRLWKDVYDLEDSVHLDYSFPLGNVGIVKSSRNVKVDYEYHFFYDIEVASSFYNINVAKTNAAVSTAGDMDIAGNMDVQPDAWLTLNNGDVLNIGGDFTHHADVDGMSSFINKGGTVSVGGEARVEQYVTSDQWHYVSSPISDGLSGVYTGAYLKWFNEPTYAWNYITATTDPLGVMMGYAAWNYTDDYTATFSGTLNDGDLSIPVTAQFAGPDNIGYNLVGNPYSSAINWDTVGWTKTNVDNTIYFYDGNGLGGHSNYRYYVGDPPGEIPSIGTGDATKIIPSMQGFFVRASADGTLGVPNGARVHDGLPYYKNSKASENTLPQIRLKVSNLDNMEDELVVRFYEDATLNHDSQYDAFKLFGYLVPSIYTITDENQELAINTLPDFDISMVVPMGFKAAESGEFNVTMTEFDNFEPGVALFIEDNLTGEVQNLSESPVYSFVGSPDNTPDRFLLYFSELTDVEESIDELVHIYSYNNNVVVKMPEGTEKATIRIYDLMGKTIHVEEVSDQVKVSIPVSANAGHYVVKVETLTTVMTEKVFLK